MTFSDLTLTLTWAKYETISLFSTFAWSLGVHMESFGWKMLRLRSLRSATWKHPILTFDLTLTWHVTSILNFRKWFGSVSSRSFECRLVRLSTSIRFRDSTGGRIDPRPQAVVGTETAQAVAGWPARWWGSGELHVLMRGPKAPLRIFECKSRRVKIQTALISRLTIQETVMLTLFVLPMTSQECQTRSNCTDLQ